jgi:hypothetical protein
LVSLYLVLGIIFKLLSFNTLLRVAFLLCIIFFLSIRLVICVQCFLFIDRYFLYPYHSRFFSCTRRFPVCPLEGIYIPPMLIGSFTWVRIPLSSARECLLVITILADSESVDSNVRFVVFAAHNEP